MIKLILTVCIALSFGIAEGQQEKTITKKKVIMMKTDDSNNESENINVEAEVSNDVLDLTITIDGKEQTFKVPLHNDEAMESLEKELEDLDIDIHFSDLMGDHDDDHDEDHDHEDYHMFQFKSDQKGGYLGVQIQNLDGQLADYFGAKDGGVLITEVIEDSPAEKAGLKAGDVIVSVAGEDVDDTGELIVEVRDHEPDSKVELNVIRKNRKRKMKVTLGEAPGMADFGPMHRKGNFMWYGDQMDFDHDDLDIYLDEDFHKQGKLKQFKLLHDDHDDMKKIWKELKELREEVESLKKDS